MYKAKLLHCYNNVDHRRTLDIDGLQSGGQVVPSGGGGGRSPGSDTNTRLLPIQLPGETVHLGLELVPQTQQLGVSQVDGVLVTHPGVPPTVITLPELHVPADRRKIENSKSASFPGCTLPDGGHGEQGLVLVQRSAVHRVEVERSLAVDQGPQGLSSKMKN